MKQITLVSLTLENFRSFKTETTIEFSTTDGIKLITGENQVEPELGANGSGKSTLFDGLCFCNYGTSIQGLRASDLISYGEKDITAIAHYLIDGEPVYITRTSPPERIYIQEGAQEARRVEQIDVNRLLGLSRDRFMNSVIFGQAMPLFIDLDIPKRGELIDEVLELGFWLAASDKAGGHATNKQRELNLLAQDIARAEGQLSALSNVADLTSQAKDWEEERTLRFNNTVLSIEAADTEVKKLQTTVEEAQKAIGTNQSDFLHEQENKANATVARSIATLGAKQEKLQELQERAEFYSTNNECPKCGQEIAEGLADKHLEELAAELDALEAAIQTLETDIERQKKKAVEARQVWLIEFNRCTNADRQAGLLSVELRTKQQTVERLIKAAEDIEQEINPHTANLAHAKKLQDEAQTKLTLLRSNSEKASSLMAQYDYWKQAFKRVRLFCVKRILMQLEVETMNAAGALGLVGWKIKYATETETKGGTMKPGVQIEVHAPDRPGKFNTLSGGEGQRVRLCTALGLASLIQRYAGVRFNFEVFDEPSAWLSERGIENLLECLHRRAEMYQKSLYVVDHRALVYSGFKEIWNIVKDVNGSSVHLVNRAES